MVIIALQKYYQEEGVYYSNGKYSFSTQKSVFCCWKFLWGKAFKVEETRRMTQPKSESSLFW